MTRDDRDSSTERSTNIQADARRRWQKPTLAILPVSATAGGSGSTCETTSVSNASQSS